MREHGLLGFAGHDPAGRVAGRVEGQQPGVGREGGEQLVDVERPAVRAVVERNGLDAGAEDLGNLDHVRPQRRDGDGPVAGADHELGGQHQRVDAGAGDGDVLHRCVAVQPAHVVGQGAAQRSDAEVVRVERGAAREGLRGGIADEVGGDAVGLAEPERQHVGQAEAGVGDFADARGAQRADGVAGGDRRMQCGRKAGVHAVLCPV